MRRTLEGKEFVVELVPAVELQQLVWGDDERVCWRVLGNLHSPSSVLWTSERGEVEMPRMLTMWFARPRRSLPKADVGSSLSLNSIVHEGSGISGTGGLRCVGKD